MAFMQPQIKFGEWYMVDGPWGTEYVPADLVGTVTVGKPDGTTEEHVPSLDDMQEFDRASGALAEEEEHTDSVRFPIPSALRDYCQNKEAWQIELMEGWGARLSAPGYLDGTGWAVFETEAEAMDYLQEHLMDEEEVEDSGPGEGDITSADHVHWFQDEKEILSTADPADPHTPADDWKVQLRAYMNRQQFWPSVWWISDHGNAHRIDMAAE
jgi:hypothetical protein